MPEPWYDIEKAFFLDPKSGEVVARFVVFRYGLVFEKMFDTYIDAELWVTRTLGQKASKE